MLVLFHSLLTICSFLTGYPQVQRMVSYIKGNSVYPQLFHSEGAHIAMFNEDRGDR